jgi:hypothetical protein
MYMHIKSTATMDHPKAITRLVEVFQIESQGRRSTNIVHSVKLNLKSIQFNTKKTAARVTFEASWTDDEDHAYDARNMLAVFRLLK